MIETDDSLESVLDSLPKTDDSNNKSDNGNNGGKGKHEDEETQDCTYYHDDILNVLNDLLNSGNIDTDF